MQTDYTYLLYVSSLAYQLLVFHDVEYDCELDTSSRGIMALYAVGS
jgi:hypothetical protein